jgi:oligosaccharide repeat unit polymerase
MTLIIINILFALTSIALCCFAPETYNYGFCLTVFIIYVAQNILYFSFDKKRNWLGFEFFFAIAFTFTNFVYPVLYFPTRPDYWFFNIPFNINVISRSTAIAYFAYAFYMLGLTRLLKVKREEPSVPNFSFGMNQFLILFAFTVVTFICYLATGGWQNLQNVYAGGGNLRDVGLYSYFNNLFTIACYLMAIFVFRLKKQHLWFYVVFLAVCMFIILSTGSRSLALGLMLIIIVGFNNNVRRFRFVEVLGLTLLGAFCLFLIMSVRRSQVSNETLIAVLQNLHLENVTDIFGDLIVNNRNLYVLVDYADAHNLTFFHGMLIDIFSPIPGMASWLVNFFHEPIELLHGGDLPTYLYLGTGSDWGLGTNMVGEAFRSFGYVGTAIAMALIGQIVKSSYYYSYNNVYVYAIYYLFVSHAVFYPRAPLLFDPRTIIWSLLLIWVVKFVTRPLRTDQLEKIIRK